VLIEAVTVDDGVFDWPFLPTLNLMTIQIIVTLIVRITAIATSPISDARRGMPNVVCVWGVVVGICIEVLVTVMVTIAVAIEVVSAESDIVEILHSSMKP
jgi:hypothetical protein